MDDIPVDPSTMAIQRAAFLGKGSTFPSRPTMISWSQMAATDPTGYFAVYYRCTRRAAD
jgi:hypothetical protein